MLAAGSGEILRAVTLAFTGPGKALVAASPTFEVARQHGAEARRPKSVRCPWRRDGTLDLKAMAGGFHGRRTGLRLQPEQPDRRHQPGRGGRASFVKEFRAAAPEGYVLVDEVYCDYVDRSRLTRPRSR